MENCSKQAEERPIRVILVDDHPLVRAGIRTLLATEADVEVVGEADNGLEGLKICVELLPDVVVLDMVMPLMGGLEAIGHYRSAVPSLKIVILSMHSNEALIFSALQAGAHAYILKGAPSSDLINSIRTVCENDFFFSQQVHAVVIGRYANRSETAPRSQERAIPPRMKETDISPETLRLLDCGVFPDPGLRQEEG